jgi:serine/threonine protein kinase
VVTNLLVGAFGFLCPTYARMNTVTEKTDVYSFGMVLLGLLTGRHPVDYAKGYENEYQPLKVHLSNRPMNEIVDPAILAEEGGAGLEQQLQAVRQLVLTCIEVDPEIRPTMVDVTKELRRIERSIA